MPLTTTATWPTLTQGRKAKASEVEYKFDWLEGAQYPMKNGEMTNGVYDLGSSAYQWKNIYANSVIVNGYTVTSDMSGYGVKAWGIIKSAGTLSSNYNIASSAYPATGTYDIVWTTPFSSDNYTAVVSPGQLTTPASTPAFAIAVLSNMTAGGLTVTGKNFAGAAQGLNGFSIIATGDN